MGWIVCHLLFLPLLAANASCFCDGHFFRFVVCCRSHICLRLFHCSSNLIELWIYDTEWCITISSCASNMAHRVINTKAKRTEQERIGVANTNSNNDGGTNFFQLFNFRFDIEANWKQFVLRRPVLRIFVFFSLSFYSLPPRTPFACWPSLSVLCAI